MTSSANPDRASSLPDELVKINRFIAPPGAPTPNETGAEDVGNSTSSAPAPREKLYC